MKYISRTVVRQGVSRTLLNDRRKVRGAQKVILGKVFLNINKQNVHVVPAEFAKTRPVKQRKLAASLPSSLIEILLFGACSEFCNYDRRLLIIVYRSWVEITLAPHASTKYREILGRYFLDQIYPNKPRYASLYRPTNPTLSCFLTSSRSCVAFLLLSRNKFLIR